VSPVRFPVPCEVAYDYLVDPVNRPRWQSSLRAVAEVDGAAGALGQTWVDRTVLGVHARMELIGADRPHRWVERGRWRGIEGTLSLDFAPVGDGCEVQARMDVVGRGPARALAFAARLAAPPAVRADLRRAARLLNTPSRNRGTGE